MRAVAVSSVAAGASGIGEEEMKMKISITLGLLALLGEQHYVAQLVKQPDDD